MDHSKALGADIRLLLAAEAGRTPDAATPFEAWKALSSAVLARISDDWRRTGEAYGKARQAHYFSAEFLEGRALVNNLVNLGLLEDARRALAAMGIDLAAVEEAETDAGLGNGGLGRLAACFLDSAATRDLPLTGYGLLYRYGIFRQTIETGFQKETPDPWFEHGHPWIVRRDEERVRIDFPDVSVWAVPYDMPITGFGTRNVNTLRLWRPEPTQDFDFVLFNAQRYDDAIQQRNRVNDIGRVIYPNDTTHEGKLLRLRQQYFFSAASLRDIVRKHKAAHGSVGGFAAMHRIQLNDTHPVVSIPELLRLLLEEGLDFDAAFRIAQETFAYTNHTIMAEALESWDVNLFCVLLPDVYAIVERIDARFRAEMAAKGLAPDRIARMAPIGDGRIRMAWLALYVATSVNGVAAIHTRILREQTLRDWHEVFPERFSNKTNGVTPRRWLRVCNPELSELLTKLSGNDAWVRDLDRLSALAPLASDKRVLKRFLEVKATQKRRLAAFLLAREGVAVDPESLFDVQVKRMHEYKRQLLNALYILDLYFRLKEKPDADFVPRTFVFGGKAAPGYFRAKATIKLVNEIARLVDGDPAIRGRIKVVFVHDYCVSAGERIYPAADLSEQISTAGTEASGTGNMKFMMNGAVTLGTYDGANVEIVEAVGEENAFIFGARVEHFPGIRSVYDPKWQYNNIPGLKRAVDALTDGTLDDGGTGMFHELQASLLYGVNWQPADVYYVLGDFEDYRKTRDLAAEAYRDRIGWAAMCWRNLCAAGRFSSDRTIADYADGIWRILRTPIHPIEEILE